MSQLQELEHDPADPRRGRRVSSWWSLVGWPLTALVLTLLTVRAAISYTRRRGMLDLPGYRRSHVVATPRGGGIGIVAALLVCVPGALLMPPAAWTPGVVWSLIGALVLVALAGWWDDRRSLPITPRLAVQVLAVAMFSVMLLRGESTWWLLLLLPVGVWSINLHNFMDGIDGLLALQVVFVGSALAVLAWWIVQPALATAAAVLALSALGFWYYNRSPARIFMGDVGSGSVGLMIFALSAMLWRVDAGMFWPVLILSSAFAVDAALTLLSRMLRGRRWYTAHREHLYQWLVRRGVAHAQVALMYLTWNVLVAAPLAWFAAGHPAAAAPIGLSVYLAAVATWLLLKQRLARRHPR